uniref:Uncharacterized protein n=1 Tax=Rhizophora mucronata TaxID=61149 RepID=A0A2P2QM86_RHIMU
MMRGNETLCFTTTKRSVVQL